LLVNTCTIYKTKYELPSYIGSLTKVWRENTQGIKGLTQNLNLRTHLKLKYNIKSLNYI